MTSRENDGVPINYGECTSIAVHNQMHWAKALAHEQIHLLEANLATKSDLAAVKSDLEVRIEKVRAGLARWMLTGWVAQMGVLATLIWYLSSGLPSG